MRTVSTVECQISQPHEMLIYTGNWRGRAEIPTQTLEEREIRLEGDNKASFLGFLRKTLQWRPEDRSAAEELLADKWERGDDY
jgi:hypothetical protein